MVQFAIPFAEALIQSAPYLAAALGLTLAVRWLDENNGLPSISLNADIARAIAHPRLTLEDILRAKKYLPYYDTENGITYETRAVPSRTLNTPYGVEIMHTAFRPDFPTTLEEYRALSNPFNTATGSTLNTEATPANTPDTTPETGTAPATGTAAPATPATPTTGTSTPATETAESETTTGTNTGSTTTGGNLPEDPDKKKKYKERAEGFKNRVGDYIGDFLFPGKPITIGGKTIVPTWVRWLGRGAFPIYELLKHAEDLGNGFGSFVHSVETAPDKAKEGYEKGRQTYTAPEEKQLNKLEPDTIVNYDVTDLSDEQ